MSGWRPGQRTNGKTHLMPKYRVVTADDLCGPEEESEARPNGQNTSRKGSAAENYVANWLRERGWLVGSLRHSKGGGDLLAVHTQGYVIGSLVVSPGQVWLIEVKASKQLYRDFTRAQRQEMIDTPLPPGGERWVVNKRGQELIWVRQSDWP